jgi:hypothetical protein
MLPETNTALYQKPRIDVGNYYLKWNEEKNHGIQQNEIPEVKRFLKDAIPMFDASYDILNKLQKSIHKTKYDCYFPTYVYCTEIKITWSVMNYT